MVKTFEANYATLLALFCSTTRETESLYKKKKKKKKKTDYQFKAFVKKEDTFSKELS